jgi:hypothetical protein
VNALKIIGTLVGGAAVGGGIGAWIGDREGGDFNLAPGLYGLCGLVVGGFIGGVVGAVAFVR